MELWDIMDWVGELPCSNGDPKVLKVYQKRVKRAMSIINPNLANNQLNRREVERMR